jgi:hypothetical protein
MEGTGTIPGPYPFAVVMPVLGHMMLKAEENKQGTGPQREQ